MAPRLLPAKQAVYAGDRCRSATAPASSQKLEARPTVSQPFTQRAGRRGALARARGAQRQSVAARAIAPAVAVPDGATDSDSDSAGVNEDGTGPQGTSISSEHRGSDARAAALAEKAVGVLEEIRTQLNLTNETCSVTFEDSDGRDCERAVERVGELTNEMHDILQEAIDYQVHETVQSALVKVGAVPQLLGLTQYNGTAAWLTLQALMFQNTQVCALLVKQRTLSMLRGILLRHGHDIRDPDGKLIMPAKPPEEEVVAAAFAASTLVRFNRNHSKLVDDALLQRLGSWMNGQDSADRTVLTANGNRPITLADRALKIVRELSTNYTMHPLLHEAGIPQALSEHLKQEKNERRRVGSLIALGMLSHASEEDAGSMVQLSEHDFAFILDAIDCTLSFVACFGEDWRLWTLLMATAALAKKEENRALMMTHDGRLLKALVEVLQTAPNVEKAALVQRYALESCWSLSFDPVAKQMLRDLGLVDIASEVSSKANSPSVTRAAQGLIFQLDEGSRGGAEAGADVPATGQHVMISYEWSHQQRVMLLADCLKALGYEVWLDVHNMSGSTLEAMANAVENAGVVICCVSSKYKDSQACRTEAQYAFQKQKRVIPVILEKRYKPNGWLGALMGTLLYFSMPETYMVQSVAKKLATEIGDVCLSKAHRGMATTLASDDAADGPEGIDMLSVDEYNREHVKQWLTDEGLENLAMRWHKVGIDGQALQGLMELRGHGMLKHTLKTDLGVTNPVELLKVTALITGRFNLGHA